MLLKIRDSTETSLDQKLLKTNRIQQSLENVDTAIKKYRKWLSISTNIQQNAWRSCVKKTGIYFTLLKHNIIFF